MTETHVNDQWCVARRPQGNVVRDDFTRRQVQITQPEDGEVLLQTMYLNLAPVMRDYMTGESAARERPLAIGDVIHGRGVAQVIASRHKDYAVGDVVQGQMGWQTYKLSAMTAGEKMRKMPDRGLSYSLGVSVLGMSGFSAYFGFVDRGQPKAGDTVVVSGAAGGVGSIVTQLARIFGCRVVGIAGGPEKCAAIASRCDATIDYKAGDIAAQLGEQVPEGIDLYFDNVGGPILSACLDHLALDARIVLCGFISEYLLDEPYALTNYERLQSANASMHGFFVYNHAAEFDRAEAQLSEWVSSGQLKPVEDIIDGFDAMPEGLARLYSHKNLGSALCRVRRGPYDNAGV